MDSLALTTLRIDLCILLCAFGHCLRDGFLPWRPIVERWPPLLQKIFNPTQLARLTAGVVCGLGAFAAHPGMPALWLSLAVLIGFYTDSKHGEGQGGKTWRDMGYLTISGLTSLAPLALMAVWLSGSWTALALIGFGLVKPPIWFIASLSEWMSENRFAATVFGGVVGVAIALVAV